MLPEARRILAGARGDVEAWNAPGPVDGERLLALASFHQVGGLLHHARGVVEV